MHKQIWMGPLFASVLGVLGCDRGTRVEHEMKELQEAQQESPQVANQLQRDLEKAKSDVVRLEEKVALAKQGVTDEVVEERNDVKEALKRQEEHVREEVAEAQGAAAAHNQAAGKAVQQLEKTQPAQRVEATVKTETRNVPTGASVEVNREQQQVPIENTRVIEQNRAPAGSTSTTTTTTTERPTRAAPAPAAAPLP